MLTDNMSVCLSFERRRSKNYKILCCIRKLSAYAIMLGLRVFFRWVPSEAHVSGEPTRYHDPHYDAEKHVFDSEDQELNTVPIRPSSVVDDLRGQLGWPPAVTRERTDAGEAGSDSAGDGAESASDAGSFHTCGEEEAASAESRPPWGPASALPPRSAASRSGSPVPGVQRAGASRASSGGAKLCLPYVACGGYGGPRERCDIVSVNSPVSTGRQARHDGGPGR